MCFVFLINGIFLIRVLGEVVRFLVERRLYRKGKLVYCKMVIVFFCNRFFVWFGSIYCIKDVIE